MATVKRYDAVETYCYKWGVQPPKRKVNCYGIDDWIIRNLLRHKNCLMSVKTYVKNLETFKKLFGKKNMSVTQQQSNDCILWINEQAVDRAKILILGS